MFIDREQNFNHNEQTLNTLRSTTLYKLRCQDTSNAHITIYFLRNKSSYTMDSWFLVGLNESYKRVCVTFVKSPKLLNTPTMLNAILGPQGPYPSFFLIIDFD